MRTGLIVAGGALFVCFAGLVAFFMIGSRSDQRVLPSVPTGTPDASFEVDVIKPRSARPLFGLVPTGGLGFDHKSRGARAGRIERDRLELTAEGWDLYIETDADGKIASATRLVFEMSLGGKDQRLRCRPAAPAVGYLRSVTQGGPREFGGDFQVKLATCENAQSGYVINWPPAPLTVAGSFNRLIDTSAEDGAGKPGSDR